jgi:hypothetical protein
MKLGITVTYHSGESESATVLPPEWIKWEVKTGRKITDASKDVLGISDLAFLAYSAIKREKAGQPVKPYEIWVETIADLDIVSSESPKATRVEVSAEQ